MSNTPHTLFITGAAGYVGGMLCDQFSKRDDVAKIIALDKEPQPELLRGNPKVRWVQANTAGTNWQDVVSREKPDVVIHTAWQIRELYGDRDLEWQWNVGGSDNVFAFSFTQPSVQKIIYFSTVSSYGAFPENATDHLFTEEEPFRKSELLYAEEKRVVEGRLRECFELASRKPQVFIIRPAAITGPRGRFARIRFGLQAALSGALRNQKSVLYDIVSLWVSWVPVTPKWLRQYVHEDDITDIVALFTFNKLSGSYEVFNAAPPGPAVLGPDMARAVGKRALSIYPWMVRSAFFWMWHLTGGRIPTAPGSWRGYSYPIAVDGSRITKRYGFTYRCGSREAFERTTGRYESDVPEGNRRS